MNFEKNLVEAAQAEGLLPSAATQVLHDPSPSWTITLLTLIGAQFAVWPLIVVLGLLGGDIFLQPPMSFVFAGLLMVGAIVGLRNQLNLLLTHICFSLLLTGFGLLTFSMLEVMSAGQWSLLVLLVLQVGAAMLVRVGWVQRLLGLGAAVVFLMLIPQNFMGAGLSESALIRHFPLLPNALLLSAVWAAWCLCEVRLSGHTVARNMGAFFEGVGVALLCTQIYAARGFFMGDFGSGSRMGSADDPLAGTGVMFALNWVVVVQVALTIAAWWWLTQRWKLPAAEKRTTWTILTVVYLCLVVFGFFTHDGGIVAVVGTVALATGRKRMLALTLVVLLAQLSGFYYALSWPLAHKALLLAVVGAFLGLFLWALRRQFSPATLASASPSGVGKGAARKSVLAMALIATGAVLSLGAANYDVMKKEQVITGGQKIYLALVPRDPRSLMQGDYMALNFAFARTLNEALGRTNQDNRLQTRAKVVAKLDTRGVAQVLRAASPGPSGKEVLAAGEILLPVLRKGGEWVLVTDAFFFPEGRGEPFKAAKFGEFRALPDGRALLVGLVDDKLKTIVPATVAVTRAEREALETAPEQATAEVAEAAEVASTTTNAPSSGAAKPAK